MRNFQHDFLNGKINYKEYLAGVKKSGLISGLTFGSFMSLAFIFFDSIRFLQVKTFWITISTSLIGGIVSGLLFGGWMYLWLLSIAKKTISAINDKPSSDVESVNYSTDLCPVCGSMEMKILTWKTHMMLHWIINPALAFNELLLGQRVPKETYKCKKCGNYFIKCPKCNVLTNSMEWNKKKALFQWNGLKCLKCSSTIPCLRNGLAGLILIITSPIWWLIKKVKY